MEEMTKDDWQAAHQEVSYKLAIAVEALAHIEFEATSFDEARETAGAAMIQLQAGA